jgi:hypothetical protein
VVRISFSQLQNIWCGTFWQRDSEFWKDNFYEGNPIFIVFVTFIGPVLDFFFYNHFSSHLHCLNYFFYVRLLT